MGHSIVPRPYQKFATLKRFIELGSFTIGIVMPAGLCDFVHRIEQGGDKYRMFPVVEVASLIVVLDILPDETDFGTIVIAEVGIREIIGHVVVVILRDGIIFDYIIHDLLRIISLRTEPGVIAHVIAVHYVVRDYRLPGESGRNRASAGKDIGDDIDPRALLIDHLGDKRQELVFVAQVSAIVNQRCFIQFTLESHSRLSPITFLLDALVLDPFEQIGKGHIQPIRYLFNVFQGYITLA